MGVFTQLASSIKGVARKSACKCAYASCVNGPSGCVSVGVGGAVCVCVRERERVDCVCAYVHVNVGSPHPRKPAQPTEKETLHVISMGLVGTRGIGWTKTCRDQLHASKGL